MSDFLRVENVSKKYDGQTKFAVSDVSFSVQQGEFFSILGESGSGKSTLLNIISALDVPDTGNIYLKNENIKDFALNLVAGHPDIKPVFQQFKLLPYHKIHENIAYPLRRYKPDYQKQRVAELLKLCRLEEVANKLPHELSGGEQQRTALAVALAQNPILITADEPFSNLDSILKNRLQTEFQRIIKEIGITIIFVTHDFRDALSLSDRIAVMQNGKLLQIDSPQNLYHNPKNEYIARLFGEVNIIPKDVFLSWFPDAKITKNSAQENENLFIRPENFSITTSQNTNCEGFVEESRYFGNYYLNKIQISGVQLIVQSLKSYSAGESISLTWQSWN